MTKVISFFSYKGGAGRSTLAYNVIPILAKEHMHPTKESPIIVVDMDIDSCGMSYLVNADKKVKEEFCVQQMLLDGITQDAVDSIDEHPFLKGLIPVGNEYGYEDNDAILLLPAYDNKNANKNLNSNYSDAGSNPFIKSLSSLIRICSEQFDVPAIILDSSVGNNATANTSNAVSDIVVCCMRPTTQFTNGTLRYLLGAEEDSAIIADEANIILVPNVIPKDSLEINGKMYPEFAYSKIQNDFIKNTKRSRFNYHYDMIVDDVFGIPAVDRFMWAEGILYNEDSLNENEKTALGQYKKLAALISDIEL